ncbi:MAG: hypothetical protein BJ554DRAFT_8325, partial [Olpidium bornovanus]
EAASPAAAAAAKRSRPGRLAAGASERAAASSAAARPSPSGGGGGGGGGRIAANFGAGAAGAVRAASAAAPADGRRAAAAASASASAGRRSAVTRSTGPEPRGTAPRLHAGGAAWRRRPVGFPCEHQERRRNQLPQAGSSKYSMLFPLLFLAAAREQPDPLPVDDGAGGGNDLASALAAALAARSKVIADESVFCPRRVQTRWEWDTDPISERDTGVTLIDEEEEDDWDD